jgi:hypothetical protein
LALPLSEYRIPRRLTFQSHKCAGSNNDCQQKPEHPTSSRRWSLLRHIQFSSFEPSLVCYSSPGLRCTRVFQQTQAAIYEVDHTRINNAVENIVPLAPRLNDSTIRKALELVTHGLRFRSKLRCQAARINLTFL